MPRRDGSRPRRSRSRPAGRGGPGAGAAPPASASPPGRRSAPERRTRPRAPDRLRDREHAALREAAEDARPDAELRLAPSRARGGRRRGRPSPRRPTRAAGSSPARQRRKPAATAGSQASSASRRAHATVQREQDAVALPLARDTRRLDVPARLPPSAARRPRRRPRSRRGAAGGHEVGVLAQHLRRPPEAALRARAKARRARRPHRPHASGYTPSRRRTRPPPGPAGVSSRPGLERLALLAAAVRRDHRRRDELGGVRLTRR